MGWVLRSIFVGLTAGLLTGCILSDGPLFPSGALVAQTPIAQGWYIARDSFDRDGERKLSVGLTPAFMRLTDKTYDYFEGTKLEHRFQVFSSSPNDTVFVAQSARGRDGWGYQRIDVTEDRSAFSVVHARCNEMDATARAVLQEMGTLGPLTGSGSCRVFDAVGASVAVLKGGNFPRAKVTSYFRIPDDKIITAKSIKNGPRTLGDCQSAEYPVQSFSPAHGLAGDGEGVLRRHNIATTRTANTTNQFGFAVEVEGGKQRPWGYVALVNHKTSRAYCSAFQVMHIERWMPDAVKGVERADTEKIRTRCAIMDTNSCGSLADLVARYPGRVLAQGREVYVFPGNGLAYGQLLTVIGTQGYGPLTLLRTEADGTTYAVMERG